MQYRSLGSTGLRISEIGFGRGNTAGLMLAGNADRQRAAVEAALAAGIGTASTQTTATSGKIG